MIRLLTAGESHGKAIIFILEGLPSGLEIDIDFINEELAQRQNFFGRGGRMKIEKDKVDVISGLRGGKTIGSPISFIIWNKDWENWKDIMEPIKKIPHSPVTRPRPGHADLSGIIKFLDKDIRNILERASARETAARVAAGAICKTFLKNFGIDIWGWVDEIGGIKAKWENFSLNEIKEKISKSSLLTPDKNAEKRMRDVIKEVKEKGDTVGGTFYIVIENPVPGLGSFIQWDLKLDALIAEAVMSIPAVKGVEIGDGFKLAGLRGSQAMDEIFFENGKFKRKTNHMGGIEGGISNGENIIIRAVMKPISTLKKPLHSIDINTKEETKSFVERGDVTAVPSCCIVAQSMTAFVISNEIKRKFGGDSMNELKANYDNYIKEVKKL